MAELLRTRNSENISVWSAADDIDLQIEEECSPPSSRLKGGQDNPHQSLTEIFSPIQEGL
jgi:hypothetical protein